MYIIFKMTAFVIFKNFQIILIFLALGILGHQLVFIKQRNLSDYRYSMQYNMEIVKENHKI